MSSNFRFGIVISCCFLIAFSALFNRELMRSDISDYYILDKDIYKKQIRQLEIRSNKLANEIFVGRD
jgi:hypothetical protein